METSLHSTANSALGIAVQGNPFHAGREAAQMAKAQLRDSPPQLVIAFAPTGRGFHEFMEGVRLVTGENSLIGIPAERVLSHEHFSPEACVVLMVGAGSSLFTTASSKGNQPTFHSPVTSLMSQMRARRGNLVHHYQRRGYLLISHQTHDPANHLPRLIRAEGGLESWILRFSPYQEELTPVFQADAFHPSGFVCVESLSNTPWGFGVVGIREFRTHADIIQEGVKTAVRNALTQLDGASPSFGLLLFNFPIDHLKDDACEEIFQGAADILKTLPLVGLSTYLPFLQLSTELETSQSDTVIAVLAPQ